MGHHHAGELRHAVRRHAPARATCADRRKDAASAVADRSADAAELRLMFAIVHRVAAGPDRGELRLEPFWLDDRVRREARQAGADDAINHRVALESERGLTYAGRVAGR